MTQQPHLTAREVLRNAQPSTWLLTVTLFSVGLWLSTISFSWQWVVGALYFTLPFNFLAQGIIDGFKHRKSSQEFWVIALAGNIPFWLCLWLLGNKISALWLCITLVIIAVYDFVSKYVRSLAGLDVVIAALLVTTPFTFGAYMGNTTVMSWVPAAAALGLWAAAGYLLRELVEPKQSNTASALGSEKTYMTILALYATVPIATLIFYGWLALPVALLAVLDVWFCVRFLPFRLRPKNAAFLRGVKRLMRLHQIYTVVILLYLFILRVWL